MWCFDEEFTEVKCCLYVHLTFLYPKVDPHASIILRLAFSYSCFPIIWTFILQESENSHNCKESERSSGQIILSFTQQLFVKYLLHAGHFVSVGDTMVSTKTNPAHVSILSTAEPCLGHWTSANYSHQGQPWLYKAYPQTEATLTFWKLHSLLLADPFESCGINPIRKREFKKIYIHSCSLPHYLQ